jgi:hypothetical protein
MENYLIIRMIGEIGKNAKSTHIARFDSRSDAYSYTKAHNFERDGIWERCFIAEPFCDYETTYEHAWKLEELLLKMDDRALQKMMRELDSVTIAEVIKGLPSIADCFLRNMSKRAAEIVKEDADYMGPIKQEECERKQKEIVEIILRLVRCGDIDLPGVK